MPHYSDLKLGDTFQPNGQLAVYRVLTAPERVDLGPSIHDKVIRFDAQAVTDGYGNELFGEARNTPLKTMSWTAHFSLTLRPEFRRCPHCGEVQGHSYSEDECSKILEGYLDRMERAASKRLDF